jgi:uncharacterized protein (DUF58 family)
MNDEILKKVRQIELSTRKLMNDSMGGDYKSRFKGQGVQFSEHRVYSPGDDIRHLDWKVTARSKEPLIKQYEEERELNVLVIVDVSKSEDFGSQKSSKRDMVTDLGAMIAYAASNSGDKVGFLILSDTVQKVIPLRKGRNHVLRIIRDLVSTEPNAGGTALKEALDETLRVMKQSGIVFIISDFLAKGFESPLKLLGKKHDLIVIPLSDPSEMDIPNLGWVSIQDPETGEMKALDFSRNSVRTEWSEDWKRHQQKLNQLFVASRASVVNISTREDYAEVLVRFLRKRKNAKK